MLENGTMQACALKRLRFSTEKEQAMAKSETAALQAVSGVAHVAQLVYAGPYPQPVPHHRSWALVMRCTLYSVYWFHYQLNSLVSSTNSIHSFCLFAWLIHFIDYVCSFCCLVLSTAFVSVSCMHQICSMATIGSCQFNEHVHRQQD